MSQAASDCVPSFWGRSMETEAQTSMQNLRAHVEQLAGEIGERNIYHPRALQAVASYIERQWEQWGYVVERLAYEVSGVRCLNLEITRSGGARQREILLMGAHCDTVMGSPGANDNASGVSAVRIHPLVRISVFAPRVDIIFENFGARFRAQTSKLRTPAAPRARRRRARQIACDRRVDRRGEGAESYPPRFSQRWRDRRGARRANKAAP